VRLDFTTGDETFESQTTVTFKCNKPGSSTFIEFEGPTVHSAVLNDKPVRTSPENCRLQLDGLAAENSVTIKATGAYSHDGAGVVWFRDPIDGRTYLHSQFAEHHTYRGYACFDQPDLKATFKFTVKAPEGWVVVSNTEGHPHAGTWTFPKTKVMSTYITAVVAGQYHSVRDQHRDIPLGLFCRQSLAEYLDPAEMFEITRQGLDFFEHKFGYAYPFGKYDQLFVPDFTSGAMENAGCVTFHEKRLFRSKVTEAERMDRAETVLHEMAHMWFGDLVTMRWWDDLWLNESFAEYMGYLATTEATRFKTAWVDFATASKAGARSQDQLPTTHPIVADIPDVESVMLNLDRITYNKGAAALKQLVAWVGEEAFFDGVSNYFKEHAFGNTDLSDFLSALAKASGRELKSWSHVWLEAAGVNTLETSLEVSDGRIVSARLLQTAPPDHPTLRPHRLRIGLFDKVGTSLKRRKAIELDIDGAATEVPQLSGEALPDLLLLNDGDLTYAKVRLDQRSLNTLTHHLREIDDVLARSIAWGAIWDMTRDSELRARDYVAISINNLDTEVDAPNLYSLIKQVESCIANFCEPSHRPDVREQLALAARTRTEHAEPGSDVQLLWSNAFIAAARSESDLTWLRGLLDGTTKVEGLVVDFDLRWMVVDTLVTIGAASEELIRAELERDPSDEGQKAAASARAGRPNAMAKAAAWEAVVSDESLSVPKKAAIAGGFHRVDQLDLLRTFVKPYFDSLDAIWAKYDSEAATRIVGWMYPRAVITQEVVDATDQALKRDLPGPVRRALLESQDAIKRALRAQAFDSAGTDSRRGA
jgi:aminopeptidase N